MHKEYFDAKVQRVSIEPKITTSIQRCGFLGLTKIKTTTQIDEYFIFCIIEGADFVLKIKVEKNIFNQARLNSLVSVMLRFDFEFACYHFFKEDEEEKIIQVERR